MHDGIGLVRGIVTDDNTERFEHWRHAHRAAVQQSVLLRSWAAATREAAQRLRTESAAARMRHCTGPGCKCRDAPGEA
jgi:hypothetical protein